MKRSLRAIFYAADEAEARALTAWCAERCERGFPAMTRCLLSGWLASCRTVDPWPRSGMSNLLQRGPVQSLLADQHDRGGAAGGLAKGLPRLGERGTFTLLLRCRRLAGPRVLQGPAGHDAKLSDSGREIAPDAWCRQRAKLTRSALGGQ